MPITIVDTVGGSEGSASGTATTVSLLVNDFLVLLRATHDDGLGNFGTPTGGGTWTKRVEITESSNSGAQAWTAPITSGGAAVVTTTYSGSGDNGWCLYALRGVLLSAPVDDFQSAALDNTPALALPSMTAIGTDDLLLAGWACRGPDVQVPAALTQGSRYNLIGSGAFGHQFLSASGATGTRTSSKTSGDESQTAVGLLIRSDGAAVSTRKRGQFASQFPGGS